ncbi:alpha/beta hydrolase [Mesorhizobium sp. RP14(2022)]|uniref:Alpha/beta hydrolase n=1 Tax=Mesorhizobium liriopis TaxID=2953882 RepID=A0ABT1C312_9HYPH|nr:alpha/beta hydrolase [Mesorhizobium liriopis]
MNLEALEAFTFQRDGLALAAYDAGGDGLPVVFQHGLCGDARQVAEAFPDNRTFRLVTLECRGHGRSETDGTHSIATFADDVAALITFLGLGPVMIGGISMGAAIASRLAVKRPELVRGLIFARPAWITETGPKNMQPNAEVGVLLARLSPDEAQAVFERGETFSRLSARSPDNLQSLQGFFSREPLAVTANLLSAIAADGPGITEAELAALPIPTLVLGTEEDFIHPLDHAEKLAALIPGAQLEMLTPKARDRAAYIADFHRALRTFLQDF